MQRAKGAVVSNLTSSLQPECTFFFGRRDKDIENEHNTTCVKCDCDM